MAEWTAVADLGTAGGTALLAVATFFSTRSANRAARSAERSLLDGLRPLLVPSRWQDPLQKIRFVDGHWTRVEGGRGVLEIADGVAYLVMSLRNAGRGIAVLDGWDVPDDLHASPRDAPTFHRLTRDIYVPPGDQGFWQGAVRDAADPLLARLADARATGETVLVDLLYGDAEGGQRVITRFSLTTGPAAPGTEPQPGARALSASRHWQLDRRGPR